MVMDHQAGKCSTVLKTELATKLFFLQVFCLGWRMQHQGHIRRRCVWRGKAEHQLLLQFSRASSCSPSPLLLPLPSPHPGREENAVQLYVTDIPTLRSTDLSGFSSHEIRSRAFSVCPLPWLTAEQAGGRASEWAFPHRKRCSDAWMEVGEISRWLFLRLSGTL